MMRLPWPVYFFLGLVGLSALALSLEEQTYSLANTASVIRKTPQSISAPGEVRINGKTTIVDMPPAVLRTLIKPGDKVEAGQVIFLLPSYQQTMARLLAAPIHAQQDWPSLSRQITSTKIRAPISGQVLRIHPIVEIADPREFQVIAHSQNARKGQPAIVVSDSREFLGQVVEVADTYATIQLNDPAMVLSLIGQSFKVKFVDDSRLALYN